MPLVAGPPTGVYAIQNRHNGKVYVGSASKSFALRFQSQAKMRFAAAGRRI